MNIRTKLAAGCSYLGILCFIPLLGERDDRFIQFHARQGLVIWLWGLVSLLLLPSPFGQSFFAFSATGILAFSIFGVISIALGKTWQLPLVFEIAELLRPRGPPPVTAITIRGASIRKRRHAC